MGVTDHGAIVQLGPDDALASFALSGEAHWNQNEADWRFFLQHSTVLGIRDADGQLIATAALLPYPPATAWISMVLVTMTWRRHGLATKLLNACIDLAKARGLTPWLDATPAGATVYGPMGFTMVFPVWRLRLEGGVAHAAPSKLSGGNFDEFLARDRQAMGFDRNTLLGELSARPGSRLVSRDGAIGLVRSGRKSRHIGPLFAARTDQALALIEAITRSETGPVLIDAIGSHTAFFDGLVSSGWVTERPFERMRYGAATGPTTMPPLACAGPEYG